jgi:hypothetical protein
MLRSSRTGPTKIGSLSRASAVIVGALVALFGVIAGPLLGVFAATSAGAATTGSGYTAITPYRALGTSAAGTPVIAGTPAAVQITSATAGEVPAGATAAVLNVTASNPTSAGYLEVYPGATAPATATSNVNFVSGETVANLVTVPLSATGGISIANFAGTTAVDVDVEGYYGAAGAGLYNAVTPVRVAGSAAVGTAIAANTAVPVTVTGGTIPSNATAVVVNLTAAGGTAASYLSAYAAGATPATTSSLNFLAGETVANRDIVNVGTGGQIEVYNFTGSVNVDVDVDGYYGATGSSFVPLATPVRVTDTRAGTALNGTPIPSGGTEGFNLATTASGIPTTATAVAANFTVVPGVAPGYITVYPTGVTSPPTASDVNWPAKSGPVANFTQAGTTGTSAGSVEVYNLDSGSPVDLVIDAFGYFTTTTTGTLVGTVNIPVTNPTTAPTAGVAITDNGTSTETVTATVYHGTAGGGVKVAGDPVLFSVSPTVGCGTLSTTSGTTSSTGVATTTYTAPTYVAGTTATSCTISATDADYGETSTATIAQSAPANTIAVTGNANVAANGTSTDTLTAAVTPAAGRSAASDVVTFTFTGADCGTPANTATSTATTPTSGTETASTTYTSNTAPGFCSVVASDSSGAASAPVTIDQTMSPPLAAATVVFSAPTTNPDAATTGTAVPLGVTVTDGGAAVHNDPIVFTTSGTSCGTTPTASATSNTGTAATSTYTQTVAGTCTITAQEADTGATTVLTVNASAPAETAYITPPGNGVTGTVPVAIGTGQAFTLTVANDSSTTGTDTATFSASGTGCGTFASATEPITLTSGGGTSSSDTYTAGNTTGFCTITATTATGATATATVDQNTQGGTVPAMVSAVHSADILTVTYNEPVNCGTGTDFSGAAIGSGALTSCVAANSTTLVLTYTTATAAGTLTYTAPGTNSTTASVQNPESGLYAATQTVTAT